MIKKPKEQKKRVMNRILKFTDYKNCLLNNEIVLKSQQRFNHSKDLKAKLIMYILKKWTRLH